MHRDVVSVDAGMSLRELAELMASEEVGSVLVTEDGLLVGIVTERDIVVAVGNGDSTDFTRAGDVMSENPISADVDDTLHYAAERMARAGFLHLPVPRDGEAVGVISARDLLQALTDTTWAEWAAEPSSDDLGVLRS
jgi:CBS domain-containing protein